MVAQTTEFMQTTQSRVGIFVKHVNICWHDYTTVQIKQMHSSKELVKMLV